MKIKNLPIVFILVLSIPLFASDYYVDAVNGSNDNSGTSKDDAWKTITHTLSQVEGTSDDPAKVFVAEGTYNEESGEIFPLEMKSFIYLIGSDKEITIIDKKISDDTYTLIDCASITNSAISNLKITGWGCSIRCFQSSPKIKNCMSYLQKCPLH